MQEMSFPRGVPSIINESIENYSAVTFLSRNAPNAWQRPTVVVDLPSPSGVGVMPPTTT